MSTQLTVAPPRGLPAKITAIHLARAAYIYIRQSTLTQVHENLESQRRQYGLVDQARPWGWHRVEVIDDDLGRSGGGRASRPGFERLVSAVCMEEAGAVFAVDVSRFARNSRDWAHLADLCGLTGTLIIDDEGVYDPRESNDRLLLGLKGTMSEWELSVMRQRSFAALQQKAARCPIHDQFPLVFCARGMIGWSSIRTSASSKRCALYSSSFAPRAARDKLCSGFARSKSSFLRLSTGHSVALSCGSCRSIIVSIAS